MTRNYVYNQKTFERYKITDLSIKKENSLTRFIYTDNEKILTDNKNEVEQYKSGKDKLFGFFVGQVMKVSGGTANPQLVNDILKKKLK